jgi:16S rRNA (cytosine1402-N4)-methyltransferase
MDKLTYHVPVLPKETLQYLNPKPGEIFVDCTLGGGGHSELILEKIGKEGKLIAIDCDEEAIEEGRKRLQKYVGQLTIVNDNFVNLKNILTSLNIEKVDGILIDLGVSSHQLETPIRGFSFNDKGLDAPLDMRMNRAQQFSAFDVVNFYPEKKLKEIFYNYGEESYGGKIAKIIVERRMSQKIETCGQLLDLIRQATPPSYRFSREHGHWASKIFRALRMEVNQELAVIEDVFPQALEVLNKNGRLVIISFHSLEDRMVKHQFIKWASMELVDILTKKPVEATPEEALENSKSASAKLRAVKKN